MKIESVEFVLSAGDVAECPDVEMAEIACSGRSNVGKSSLLNFLFGRRALAKVSGTPGKTQRLNFFIVNERFHVVDLPGYGFAKASGTLRNQWSRMMQGYLRKRRQLVGLLQLVDSRHPPSKEDREMVQWLVAEGLPFCLVATKGDKVAPSKRPAMLRALARELDLPPEQPMVCASSHAGDGRKELLAWIAAAVEAAERG